MSDSNITTADIEVLTGTLTSAESARVAGLVTSIENQLSDKRLYISGRRKDLVPWDGWSEVIVLPARPVETVHAARVLAGRNEVYTFTNIDNETDGVQDTTELLVQRDIGALRFIRWVFQNVGAMWIAVISSMEVDVTYSAPGWLLEYERYRIAGMILQGRAGAANVKGLRSRSLGGRSESYGLDGTAKEYLEIAESFLPQVSMATVVGHRW